VSTVMSASEKVENAIDEYRDAVRWATEAAMNAASCRTAYDRAKADKAEAAEEKARDALLAAIAEYAVESLEMGLRAVTAEVSSRMRREDL